MSPDAIRDELDRLERTCDTVLEISRAYHSAVAAGDLDLLGTLVEERGRHLSDLNLRCLDITAGSLRAGLQNGSLAKRRSAVLSKLGEVLRIDEENKRVLQASLDDVRSQLATMSRGRQALNRYAYITVKAEPFYVDKRQ